MDIWTPGLPFKHKYLIFCPFAWALQQRTTHTRHPIGSKKYEIFFLCSLRVWRAALAPACPPPCSPPPSGLGTATQPSTRWVKSVCKYQEYESESFYFSLFFYFFLDQRILYFRTNWYSVDWEHSHDVAAYLIYWIMSIISVIHLSSSLDLGNNS